MKNKKWMAAVVITASLIIVSTLFFSLVVKNDQQEYTANLGNHTYTFTDKLGGYSTRFEEHRAFSEAKSLVAEYVIGRGGDTFILQEAGIGEWSGSGIFIKEGKDRDGNIIVGLFADKSLSATTSSFVSGGTHFTKDALKNPTGESILLAVADRKQFSEYYYLYEFDVREWRELVRIHYSNLATEARKRHNTHN